MTAATITTKNTPARMLAVRLPGVTTAPLTFTYSTASDCVAAPTRAASSGATTRGVASAPSFAASALFANASTPFARPPRSCPLTSTVPSGPETPSQRADRSTS